MDENQSDLALPDIAEAEHLGVHDVESNHENGDQVNGETRKTNKNRENGKNERGRKKKKKQRQ